MGRGVKNTIFSMKVTVRKMQVDASEILTNNY